ncbi:hypothetical protein YQE_08692, partial [Dendroctonus ponderosae]
MSETYVSHVLSLQSGFMESTLKTFFVLLDLSVFKISEWPARSPDLNVIEDVWDQLKRRFRRRDCTPENFAELENAVLQEWHNIPQEFIINLLYGIPRRLRDAIRARGGNTRY